MIAWMIVLPRIYTIDIHPKTFQEQRRAKEAGAGAIRTRCLLVWDDEPPNQ